jgi:hypothetical protein
MATLAGANEKKRSAASAAIRHDAASSMAFDSSAGLLS